MMFRRILRRIRAHREETQRVERRRGIKIVDEAGGESHYINPSHELAGLAEVARDLGKLHVRWRGRRGDHDCWYAAISCGKRHVYCEDDTIESALRACIRRARTWPKQ